MDLSKLLKMPVGDILDLFKTPQLVLVAPDDSIPLLHLKRGGNSLEQTLRNQNIPLRTWSLVSPSLYNPKLLMSVVGGKVTYIDRAYKPNRIYDGQF